MASKRRKSGVSHITADSEADAYWRARRLVSIFTQQGRVNRAAAEAGDTDLKALLPESNRRAYDVHPVIEKLLDSPLDWFLERVAGADSGVIAAVGTIVHWAMETAPAPTREALWQAARDSG